MSPHLHLIASTQLDAYEADRRTRADLQSRYLFALDAWDVLDLIWIEALAAEYDHRHPDETPVLDGHDTPAYLAAA
ncbi:hypothetical protein ACIOEX_01450 [Streptomyces sp. NPDC087850]|uniref:hypothetical protein n=1 Tax=Streptomyces sp. NPDC087850 TaxID=3365809 RepID=UPI0038301D87